MLVISHEVFNKNSGTVIALAITSRLQRAGFPLTYELKEKKMPKKSWVKISQIRTLSTKRLGKKICSLDKIIIDKIIDGLNEIVGE